MKNYIEYERIKHKSGLNIILIPKKDFTASYAVIGANYGSVDSTFYRNNEKITVPAGTAHFLEHKLFENEDIDAFAEYAKTGASANAFTSFDKTCYLFKTTDNFAQSLKILLKYTLNPYFTDETVKKEQGIIAEEIKMYQDNPGWQAFFGLLRGMYGSHPVSTDIAGTVESISKITPGILYKCFDCFYNLNNMVLAVAGNFDKDEVISVCDEMLKNDSFVEIGKEKHPCGSGEIFQSVVKTEIPVGVPVYSMGFKEDIEGDELRNELLSTIALEMFAGDISPLYKDMYQSGIINDSFSTEVFSGKDYLSFIFEGEGGDCDAVYRRIIKEAENKVFSTKLFETAKKEIFGRNVRVCDSISGLGNLSVSLFFSGYAPDEAIKVLNTITADEVENYMKKILNPDRFVLSTVGNKGGI